MSYMRENFLDVQFERKLTIYWYNISDYGPEETFNHVPLHKCRYKFITNPDLKGLLAYGSDARFSGVFSPVKLRMLCFVWNRRNVKMNSCSEPSIPNLPV